jgi:hypothetical protein
MVWPASESPFSAPVRRREFELGIHRDGNAAALVALGKRKGKRYQAAPTCVSAYEISDFTFQNNHSVYAGRPRCCSRSRV